MRHVVLRKCTLYNFYNHYLGTSLGRVKTLQAFSPVIPGEILFQKINCGCFATHSKVLSFQPKQSAQDSMESLWKLFQKLNCGFFFVVERKVFRQKRVPKIPHGASEKILFQKINCGIFVARKVFPQNRVPKIPWRACWNPNQPAPPSARSMAQMHLLSTAEINASVLPSGISFLLFCSNLCLPSLLCSRGLAPALIEVVLMPDTGFTRQ